MSRRQTFIFAVFLIVPISLLALKPEGKFRVANALTPVLLYPIRTIGGYLQFLNITGQCIEDLEREIELLKLENAQLGADLRLQENGHRVTAYQLVKSRIIGRDPSNINGYLIINRGADHGLAVDQAVICSDGLVGQIRYVGANESLVETIENHAFSVSALNRNTDVHGVVKRVKRLHFEYIRISDEIYVNDTVVTSGMSEIFPVGIVIGYVHNIKPRADMFFKDVYLEPAARVNRLYYVYVITDNPSRGIIDRP